MTTGVRWSSTLWCLILLGWSSQVNRVEAVDLVASPCVGFTDAAALQAKLRTAHSGDVLSICSDISLSATLQITRPVTIQGVASVKLVGLPGPVNQAPFPLVVVADGVGPVAFLDLEFLNSGLGAPAYGGAVQVGVDSLAAFTRVTFRDNVAEYGGAVYVRGNALFTGCAFINNTAYGSGGAIYTDNATSNVSVTVLSSSFLASAAGQSGGAIHFDDGGGVLRVSDSTFVGSTAGGQGGTLYLAPNAVGVITASRFLNGSSATGGGALYLSGSALLAANNFTGNKAPIGGAVYTDGSINTAFCGGDRFSSNAAQSEGYGNSVFVQSTPDGDGTAFCPSVPDLGVDVAGSPVGGVTIGSCLNCDPAVLCAGDATGGLQPALQPVGIACTCNPGFQGSGFLCYPVGSAPAAAVSISASNLTAGFTPAAFNSSLLPSRSTTVSPLSVTEGRSGQPQPFENGGSRLGFELPFVSVGVSLFWAVLSFLG